MIQTYIFPILGSFITHITRVFGCEDEKACVLVWLLKDIKELEFLWNWVKMLKNFNNSPRIGTKPLDKGWDLLDTHFEETTWNN